MQRPILSLMLCLLLALSSLAAADTASPKAAGLNSKL